MGILPILEWAFYAECVVAVLMLIGIAYLTAWTGRWGVMLAIVMSTLAFLSVWIAPSIREVLFYGQFVLAAIGLFGLTRSAIRIVFRAKGES